MPDTTLPWIVSTDDHIMEPSRVWQDRLPRRMQEAGPRVERGRIGRLEMLGIGKYTLHFSEDGILGDYWLYENRPIPMKRNFAAAGMPLDLHENVPITYDDMRPGCFDVTARLLDMDQGHVEASLCFPTFPRFCGQTFLEGTDKELALACVQAYNDFMVEEWSAPSKGRLVPLCLVPLWDVMLAAAEVRRNAARGVHAVAFSEIPAKLGLPSIHSREWDPFFEACNETDTAICMHIGSSSSMAHTSADAPMAVNVTIAFTNSALSLTDYLLSGVLIRFPKLKLAYSEGQIGWLPYLLERVDDVWTQHRGWAGLGDSIPEPPSSYYRRHVYGCFFRDQHGIDSIDVIGVDNVTLETDYPHTDSTWPGTAQLMEKSLAALDSETVWKIVRGNAIRLLSLEDSMVGSKSSSRLE